MSGAVRELTIRALATGGDGVADLDGRAVYVRAVAPGERIRVELTDKGARLLEVLEPSADRTEPRCPDTERCGGCDWMHLTPSAQSREHRLRVERLLGAKVTHQLDAAACGPRERARLHAKRGRLGYFGVRSKQLMVPARCAILDPRLEAARQELGELVRREPTLEGDVSLALGAEGRPVAHLALRQGEPSGAFSRAVEQRVEAGALGGVAVRAEVDGAHYRYQVGDASPQLCAADGLPLALPAGGFSQSSERGNRLLAERVLHHCRPLLGPTRAAVELHAGAGNFSVLLAAETSALHTYEANPEAVELARQNLRRRELRAKVHLGQAEDAPLPKKLPLLLLDPPRHGAKGVLSRARAAKVERVVYVSCNPLTLARDRAELGDDYELAALELFELFGETSHVETLAVFSRRP